MTQLSCYIYQKLYLPFTLTLAYWHQLIYNIVGRGRGGRITLKDPQFPDLLFFQKKLPQILKHENKPGIFFSILACMLFI